MSLHCSTEVQRAKALGCECTAGRSQHNTLYVAVGFRLLCSVKACCTLLLAPSSRVCVCVGGGVGLGGQHCWQGSDVVSLSLQVLNVGSYATELEAARAWNAAAVHFRGVDTLLNPVEPCCLKTEGWLWPESCRSRPGAHCWWGTTPAAAAPFRCGLE